MKYFLKALPYLVGFTSPLIFLIGGSFVNSIGAAILALTIVNIFLGIVAPKSFKEYSVGAFSFGIAVFSYLTFKNGTHVAMGDFLSSIFVPFAMCVFGWVGIVIGSLVRNLCIRIISTEKI